jgi:hypothetical protein
VRERGISLLAVLRLSLILGRGLRVAGHKLSDTRSQIGDALAGKLTEAQLVFLMDEVLAITKRAHGEFSCKNCGQRQRQPCEIPDAKAVTGALVDLANQAWGRPSEDKAEVEGVTLVRKIVYNGSE